jgi:hypothetical protein
MKYFPCDVFGQLFIAAVETNKDCWILAPCGALQYLLDYLDINCSGNMYSRTYTNVEARFGAAPANLYRNVASGPGGITLSTHARHKLALPIWLDESTFPMAWAPGAEHISFFSVTAGRFGKQHHCRHTSRSSPQYTLNRPSAKAVVVSHFPRNWARQWHNGTFPYGHKRRWWRPVMNTFL